MEQEYMRSSHLQCLAFRYSPRWLPHFLLRPNCCDWSVLDLTRTNSIIAKGRLYWCRGESQLRGSWLLCYLRRVDVHDHCALVWAPICLVRPRIHNRPFHLQDRHWYNTFDNQAKFQLNTDLWLCRWFQVLSKNSLYVFPWSVTFHTKLHLASWSQILSQFKFLQATS